MEREESTCRTCFGRRCEYFNGCPLSSWYPGSDHSFIPPSLAPESQKSGSPTTGFREREKEASTWDEPLARAPPQTAPSGPRTKTANRPACDDSWTDRQGIIPRFLFSILTQHVACRMSHGICHMPASWSSSPDSSSEAHHRFVKGFYMRVRYINLPLAAVVLPNSPDISPSLVPPCPVSLCLPRLSLPPGTTIPPRSTPQNARLLPQLATVPLARLQFLTRANTHDGTRLTISLQ